MSDIKSWVNVAASNNAVAPDGFPEGMAPSGVNDAAREVMAAVRRYYEAPEWRDFGHTATYINATQFRVTNDQTAIYLVNRPIRCTDATTLYGIITAVSYSAPNTTITVALDSGNLSASLTAVAVGMSPATSHIPPQAVKNNTAYTATGTDTYTVSGLTAATDIDYPITFANANTSTTPTLNGTTIVKEGATALVAGDIPAGHNAILRKTASNFVLLNPAKITFKGCMVYLSAAQSTINGGLGAISFTDESYDTHSIHDNVTNNSRLTVPAGFTKVILKAQVQFAISGTGYRQLIISKNASTSYTGVTLNYCAAPSVSVTTPLNATSPELIVAPGDYFELLSFQNSGGSLNVLADATWFCMELIN